jgi:predicted RNA-binding Zn-ribbon protein involved in translation (DUF1610 family)
MLSFKCDSNSPATTICLPNLVTDSYTQCPKCGHHLSQALPASAECPSCGIYFFKRENTSRTPDFFVDEDNIYAKEDDGLLMGLFKPLENMDAMNFYGRCIVLLFLAVWSWFLFGYDYRDGEFGSSFMHDILLPIHEAGHVLFRPFGEFMMIFGGSLFQFLLPLGIGIAFKVINQDNFGASIGLWWAGVSLVDLSPYIYDALHPQLTLIGGRTGADGPHDWIFLLIKLGQLGNAHSWGEFIHASGGLLMLLMLIWGGILLFRQREQLYKLR